MSKGQETKAAILDEALQHRLAVGFTGLTIGQLAEQTGMSKSGLFAHFKSKEQLQLQTLEHARQRFVDMTIRPALAVRRAARSASGSCSSAGSSGRPRCSPAAASSSPARSSSTTSPDRCVTPWSPTSATGSRPSPPSPAPPSPRATSAPTSIPQQFAFEVQGLTLGYHHSARLLDDPQAMDRVRTAFEALLDRARAH